jgi:hypothetical protein
MQVARIGNQELRIIHDESPESPREWDNLGHIVAFHRRYTFPQEGEEKYSEPEEFDEWVSKHKAIVILPIYMLDHSSIAMSTTPFGGLYGRFDSGQIGYIYVTYAQIRKELRVKKITPEIIEQVKATLKGEIETYSQYVNGDVYGYSLGEITKCDHGDGCDGQWRRVNNYTVECDKCGNVAYSRAIHRSTARLFY